MKNIQTGKPTRDYIELSHNQSYALGYEKNLLGRIYNMHDEMTIHNLASLENAHQNMQPIEKIDKILN